MDYDYEFYVFARKNMHSRLAQFTRGSNRRFHGRGRHLGSGANAAKFTVNVREKS